MFFNASLLTGLDVRLSNNFLISIHVIFISSIHYKFSKILFCVILFFHLQLGKHSVEDIFYPFEFIFSEKKLFKIKKLTENFYLVYLNQICISLQSNKLLTIQRNILVDLILLRYVFDVKIHFLQLNIDMHSIRDGGLQAIDMQLLLAYFVKWN